MINYYTSLNASPQLQARIDSNRDARSFALYQSLRMLGEPLRRVVDAARSIVAEYQRHRRELASNRELSSLSDRTLRDIGVDRADINRIAYALSREEVPVQRGIRAQTVLDQIEPQTSEDVIAERIQADAHNEDRRRAFGLPAKATRRNGSRRRPAITVPRIDFKTHQPEACCG